MREAMLTAKEAFARRELAHVPSRAIQGLIGTRDCRFALAGWHRIGQPGRVITAELKEVRFSGFRGAWIDSTTDPSPDDPEHFGFLMQALIGDASHDAGDAFNAYVCTPSWFAAQLQTGGWERFAGALRSTSIVDGSGIWFLRRWDRAEIDAALRLLCDESSPGPDWGSVASRIARVIPWEFDYRYDEHVNHRYGESYPATPRP